MGKVKIFSDSTCDLSPELVAQYDIGVVPVYVRFGDQVYRDGIDLTVEELYQKVDELGELPATAAPSPGDFVQAFKPYIDDGLDIVFVGISSDLSAILNNARLAAQEFPEGRVHIADGRNLSTGTGILVLKAADFAAQGMDARTIAEKIEALAPKVETEFIVDTLDYLHKGGRCTGLTRLVGSMLKIRPSLKVIGGKLYPNQKFRGTRQKALNGLLNTVLAVKDEIDPERIFITHSVSDDGPYLKEELLKHIDAKEILITQAGCVISSHCGRNTIGIIYMKK
ncbi:MAG: DegV family protein [Firmicutes bacterium]|mgnify:CR=1 FL=1|nr:DegV family protein [Bacillota bacterium]HOB34299.1 DegV family protein [Bacillota bacterium]HPZ90694.1 DegV family protein [Bacillota bacterium]HQE01510.1 DegV family protein [Bacillota bacterium]